MGRRTRKRAEQVKKKEDALEASFETANKDMLIIAESMAKKADLVDASYRLESRRMAIYAFSLPDNKGTPEALQCRMMMLRVTVDLGTSMAQTAIAQKAARAGAHDALMSAAAGVLLVVACAPGATGGVPSSAAARLSGETSSGGRSGATCGPPTPRKSSTKEEFYGNQDLGCASGHRVPHRGVDRASGGER